MNRSEEGAAPSVRIVGATNEQLIDSLPALGEERSYTVTATCLGHRTTEIDGAEAVVADMRQTSVVEKPSQSSSPVPGSNHRCGFGWCLTTDPNDPEHWWCSEPTDATLSSRYAANQACAGVAATVGDEVAVWVQLTGGVKPVDVDIYMTVAEAAQFAEAFATALAQAREVA
ncbi:hypothetical protein OG579_13645 [Williamsia herbipolensis]|uniref:Uncharacterized protein n=1 Tax=Williamsia herbipolensis TaxID=1603258 RepID=A0AAU4JY75_9NOCA|nr:hypothetical protein [Williamsia herbipolensis]